MRADRGAAGSRSLAGAPRAADALAGCCGGRPVAAAWRGARELLRRQPPHPAVSRLALDGAVRRPERVLGIGLALAALGWGLDTQTRVETDITKLVPQSLSSLQGLNALERPPAWAGRST